eukprot:TRINITY_DN16950_c0_g1_i2.p1 TRINITY_DN16950_c0_g1~~TRINITY_DN16950_c0_g1_i2.p1  ORF type:complete len:145 (-),score=24.36 TRINITY_DN16950_c0_g1_i2:38-472(-)
MEWTATDEKLTHAFRMLIRKALSSSFVRRGSPEGPGSADSLIGQLLITADSKVRKQLLRDFLSQDREKYKELAAALITYAERQINSKSRSEPKSKELNGGTGLSGQVRRIIFDASVVMRDVFSDLGQDKFTDLLEPLLPMLSKF